MDRTALFGKLKKDKRVLAVVGIGILGMLLLLLSDTGTKKTSPTDTSLPYGTEAEKELETRLEKLLGNVVGVGKVKVMVTFDGTWEDIYAQNGEEKDGEKNEEYVIVKESGDDTGLKLRSVRPEIRGVGVSCEGAGSAAVRENVTALICASLGIPSNRVYVVQAVEKTK